MEQLTSEKFNKIGAFIKTKREALGLRQEVVAIRIGVAPSTLSLYEKGARTPDLETLKKIAGILDTSLATIIDVEVPKENLDISLRSQGLAAEDINEVKDYIRYLKHKKNEEK